MIVFFVGQVVQFRNTASHAPFGSAAMTPLEMEHYAELSRHLMRFFRNISECQEAAVQINVVIEVLLLSSSLLLRNTIAFNNINYSVLLLQTALHRTPVWFDAASTAQPNIAGLMYTF